MLGSAGAELVRQNSLISDNFYAPSVRFAAKSAFEKGKYGASDCARTEYLDGAYRARVSERV